MNDEEKVKEINSWIGTKWKHGVALKGWGTDCVQFIVQLGKEFEWIPPEYKTLKYHRDWALHNTRSPLLEEVAKFCDKYEGRDYEVGDIFVFFFGKAASHAGIYVGDNMIVHAHMRHGVIKVDYRTQQGLDSIWRPRNER